MLTKPDHYDWKSMGELHQAAAAAEPAKAAEPLS